MAKVRIPVRVGTHGFMPEPLLREQSEELSDLSPTDAVAGGLDVQKPDGARKSMLVPSKDYEMISEQRVGAGDPGGQSGDCERSFSLQQRKAQDQIKANQEGLLSDMVSVADNLDRALAASREDSVLRQGVALTRDELLRLLAKYDVERIEAQGQSFDPNVHAAVAVVPADEFGVPPGTIVQVMQSGYRWEERLLRPARVVVAD